jgi:DNA-binding transcriptional LysR family regulator
MASIIGIADRFVQCENMVTPITNPDGLHGIEIRHLAALEAVADTGSFAAAGALLGYSQPAISQQIAALERVTRMRLLDRLGGRRPVVVTDAGERLLRHARRAAAALRAAEADLAALRSGEAGTLRVGSFQSVGIRLLPDVMRRMHELRPGIELRVTEASHDDELLRLLAGGELDLTFVRRTDDEAFDHVEVLSDPYVLLTPASSPVTRERRPLRPREVARLPLVAYRRPGEGGEALLRARGADPDVVFRSDDSGIVQAVVAAGIGYALVPLLTVDRSDRRVAVLEVTGIPPREIALAWHADRPPGAAGAAFIEVVERVAGRLRATTGVSSAR